jgi:hypothetical protein
MMFKLLWQQELTGGSVPSGACVATSPDGSELLCVLCRAAAQLLAFKLPG